jgi:hypothetical protein
VCAGQQDGYRIMLCCVCPPHCRLLLLAEAALAWYFQEEDRAANATYHLPATADLASSINNLALWQLELCLVASLQHAFSKARGVYKQVAVLELPKLDAYLRKIHSSYHYQVPDLMLGGAERKGTDKADPMDQTDPSVLVTPEDIQQEEAYEAGQSQGGDMDRDTETDTEVAEKIAAGECLHSNGFDYVARDI